MTPWESVARVFGRCPRPRVLGNEERQHSSRGSIITWGLGRVTRTKTQCKTRGRLFKAMRRLILGLTHDDNRGGLSFEGGVGWSRITVMIKAYFW